MRLLNLSLFKFDMFPDLRIILPKGQFLGGIPGVFLGCIIGPSTRRANELDQNCVGFSHGLRLSKRIAISPAT